MVVTEKAANKGPSKSTSVDEAAVVLLLQLVRRSSSAKDYYKSLAMLVSKAPQLSQQQLAEVVGLVRQPWKKKRGAPSHDDIIMQIFVRYMLMPSGGHAPAITRADAVREISTEYKIEIGAAEKRYDKAMKVHGSKLKAIKHPSGRKKTG